jgi:hypothetical protein
MFRLFRRRPHRKINTFQAIINSSDYAFKRLFVKMIIRYWLKTRNPKKGLPLGLIAGVSAIAVVLLFSIVGIGVYLMKSGDAGNVVANGKSAANGSTAVVVPNAATRQIKIDVDEGKAQVFRGSESSPACKPMSAASAKRTKIQRTARSPNDPQTQFKKGTLTIVADGMGGHASGEVASQMAVDLISEIYYATKDSTLRGAR